MINKKELILWGISAIIAFAFMLIVLFSNSMKATRLQQQKHREYASTPAMVPKAVLQAQIAAKQDRMSGSILRVEPSVVCICTTGSDIPGKGTQLHEIGTGVIIAANGFILTGRQVLTTESDIKVVVYEHSGLDGPSFEIGHNHIFDADIVSSFPAAGFTILKIDAANLPVAKFGDANAPHKGDWCLTIGSAFGQKPTVTSGMISGIDRTTRFGGIVYKQLIEINCKFKSYFIGGPLVNVEGEIIGIVIEKGFATPGSRIIPVLQSLGIPAL